MDLSFFNFLVLAYLCLNLIIWDTFADPLLFNSAAGRTWTKSILDIRPKEHEKSKDSIVQTAEHTKMTQRAETGMMNSHVKQVKQPREKQTSQQDTQETKDLNTQSTEPHTGESELVGWNRREGGRTEDGKLDMKAQDTGEDIRTWGLKTGKCWQGQKRIIYCHSQLIINIRLLHYLL